MRVGLAQRARMAFVLGTWQRLERLSLADYDVLSPSCGTFDCEYAALQAKVTGTQKRLSFARATHRDLTRSSAH